MAMKLRVVYQPSPRAGVCPYRLVDEQAHEIDWANAFLDAQRVRQLSLRSLRIYAYDLPHFARWAQTALQNPRRGSPSPSCSITSVINWTGNRRPPRPP